MEHILSANRLDGSPSRKERHSYLIPRGKEGEEKFLAPNRKFPEKGRCSQIDFFSFLSSPSLSLSFSPSRKKSRDFYGRLLLLHMVKSELHVIGFHFKNVEIRKEQEKKVFWGVAMVLHFK